MLPHKLRERDLVALRLAVMLRVELSDVDGVWLSDVDGVWLRVSDEVTLKLAETVAVIEWDAERVCVGVFDDERLTS